jgi:amidase
MAGATILGKAVCENFSMTGTSFSAATGPVHNPYAKNYSTGGSSSGCGALVASGAVDMQVVWSVVERSYLLKLFTQGDWG